MVYQNIFLTHTIGTAVVPDFGQFFGFINSYLFVRYKLQLEPGGRIEVDLKVKTNREALRIEIVEVFDSNGNEVPQSDSELDGLALQGSDSSRAEAINEFLSRFDRKISGAGRVIIKDCATSGCDSI